MMNETGPYSQDVFVADFTEYNNNHPETPAPHAGVLIATEENGIIPSFKLTDKNEHPFTAVNFEENPAVFLREDGTKVSQCECVFYAIREASPDFDSLKKTIFQLVNNLFVINIASPFLGDAEQKSSIFAPCT